MVRMLSDSGAHVDTSISTLLFVTVSYTPDAAADLREAVIKSLSAADDSSRQRRRGCVLSPIARRSGFLRCALCGPIERAKTRAKS